MRQPAAAMPSTISLADHLRRSAGPAHDHRHAADLLLTLAAVECHASVGGDTAVPPALLREAVIITGRLAGNGWLAAQRDGTAAFTALLAMPEPPPLAELDQVLSGVLAERFGLAATASTAGSPRRTAP